MWMAIRRMIATVGMEAMALWFLLMMATGRSLILTAMTMTMVPSTIMRPIMICDVGGGSAVIVWWWWCGGVAVVVAVWWSVVWCVVGGLESS